MAKNLFLFTIGPVQEFIAGARRSRDLWFGSALLSELSRAAAKHIAASSTSQLIFPSSATLADDQQEIVNRIIAEIEEEPTLLGHTTEAVVRTTLSDVWEAASKRVRWPEGSDAEQARATAQIADVLEFYWAAVPRTENYKRDRDTLDALIAARKTTRDFQAAIGSDCPKSSLDGIRESVIPQTLFPGRSASSAERQRKIQQLYNRFHAKQSEQLSGVDLLKRLGTRPGEQPPQDDDTADFPSTSHFAALPFLRRIATHGALQDSVKRYVQSLGHLNGPKPEQLASRFHRADLFDGYDASILFESRLTEDYDQADMDNARGALAEFLEATSRNDRPQSYYALLHADGDNMGRTIDALTSVTEHIRLSESLGRFASQVRAVVETNHDGALVYAGGDDVLAFLPLDRVLNCAHALEQAFAKEMGSFAQHLVQQHAAAQFTTPTLSVGIAVVHHLEPLADALNLARAAEGKAKSFPAKHGLAITLSKRSGVERSIVGSWNDGFFARVSEFIALHHAEAIPDAAAYELRDLSERLRGVPLEAVQREAIRIVGRKRGLRGHATETNEQLVAWAERLPTVQAPKGERQWNVQAFADELIIAREFERVMAKPEKEQA